MSMIEEVRRQFREIPGLKAGLDAMNRNEDNPVAEWSEEDQKIYEEAQGQAEYGKCVEISTKAAIKEMVKPGLLAVAAPVAVGFLGRSRNAGRSTRRRHRDGCFVSSLSVQRRWCLGQRQENDRGRGSK